jgi:hypothetical protein
MRKGLLRSLSFNRDNLKITNATEWIMDAKNSQPWIRVSSCDQTTLNIEKLVSNKK